MVVDTFRRNSCRVTASQVIHVFAGEGGGSACIKRQMADNGILNGGGNAGRISGGTGIGCGAGIRWRRCSGVF